ncbi:MAG: hypothetical protein AAF431_01160 [Pseudomonadota bacterium]
MEMKSIFTLGLCCLVFQTSGYAHTPAADLQLACEEDIELSRYLRSRFIEGAADADTLSTQEIVQIDAFVTELDAQTTSQEKIQSVITACAEARILGERFQYLMEPQKPVAVPESDELDELLEEEL